MSKALDSVLERVSRLPDQRQDEIARMIERFVDLGGEADRGLKPEHWLDVDRRLAGDRSFASDDEVEAFFSSALG